ncbi:hypothetical protein FHL15_003265 [Xylaria flabelliformis]|uniref:deoxyribose-phosphate aldolase n=1 Tax=Xylaria flabelliformis TaxID=2512241 RepID=A0A553I676_9PEZI|nr:hypothetical protein FHL15_003265 [Xylaria flabelliformis]
MTALTTITVTLPQIAKMIDYSLLHPNLTDEEIRDGLEVAKRFNVATACMKPYSIPLGKKVLAGSDVLISAVVGFPYGINTTKIKVLEAEQAVEDGAREVDMMVNIGKVRSGDFDYVGKEIRAVNEAVVKRGAALNVVLDNDFLSDRDVSRICLICSAARVAFVKTVFFLQPGRSYERQGKMLSRLRLMKATVTDGIRIKVAGGIRSLDELFIAMLTGVSRVGAASTAAILEEATARGIGSIPVKIALPPPADE